jgi:hypothetical protein
MLSIVRIGVILVIITSSSSHAVVAFLVARENVRSRRTTVVWRAQSSPSCLKNNDDLRTHNKQSQHRRLVLKNIVSSFALLLTTTIGGKSTNAACLSGDIHPDCIGVYKLPIDAPELSYFDTPEKLKVYAPDLRWVTPTLYPKGYTDALKQLNDQRLQLGTAQEFVAKGDLIMAGITLLDVIPKINAAGIIIIQSFERASNTERNITMKKNGNISTSRPSVDGTNNPSSSSSNSTKATALEMRSYRIKNTLDDLLGYLGETDILIGQGLRGELGVSAAAQLQILTCFVDITKEYDNLLIAIPEKLTLI